ncbi:MAG: endo-1,4-beta-xylanase [Spirochaetales bacterium]|nr:endo-1,4-beta-xylanase [Spirochaetales bacterium]
MNKKVLILLLLFIPLLGLQAQAQWGDVNGDGNTDIIDALLIAQYYVGLDPQGFNPEAADVDADGQVTIVDALLIARYYVGLPVPTPVLTPTPTPTSEPEPAAYQKYSGYFLVGAAVDTNSYRDAHAGLLQKHFNSIVCENEMKWDALEPSEGNFNYSTADAMVNFAQANNMKVRGHCLVWHNQIPGWVFQNASKQVLLNRMKNHITNVMNHFRGKIYCWDVVNEAVTGNKSDGSDAGEDLSQVVSWGYRNSTWYQICGEDYILEAFRAARAADPQAKLFYNDYWNYLDGKRAMIISIIRKLQAENLIDGVGLQCHLNISPALESPNNQTVYQTVPNLEEEILEYASLGLEVEITELDISVYTRDYPSSDSSKWYRSETELLAAGIPDKQAARYKEFFDMFREHGNLITNVTFWGIADDNTWLSEFDSGRPDYPLLFDKSLQPKPAYYSVVDF